MALRPKLPASLHQPIRVPPSARVLHQPPMPELLPDVPDDFTREVRRRLDSMNPTVEPEPQREPSASSLDGLREEFVSEVRRRLDRVDRVLLNVVQRVENLDGRKETDARDLVDRVLLNVVERVENLEGRRETDARDRVDRILLNVVERVENLEGRRETDADSHAT
jgi:hypothetical protein